MKTTTMDELRLRHRARMKAFGAPSRGSNYEDEVVQRVLSWVTKLDEKPVALHGLEETGMCVDCDAARLIEEIEDDS